MAGPSSPATGVSLNIRTGPQFRLRVEWPGEPELRCPKCGEWLPISPEFWHLNQWSECRTCHAERVRLRSWMRRRGDPAYRLSERARSRRYREWIRETAPQLVDVYDRERRAKKAAQLRTYRARRRNAA